MFAVLWSVVMDGSAERLHRHPKVGLDHLLWFLLRQARWLSVTRPVSRQVGYVHVESSRDCVDTSPDGPCCPCIAVVGIGVGVGVG